MSSFKLNVQSEAQQYELPNKKHNRCDAGSLRVYNGR